MMNQFKNLATIAEADATSTKRNSVGPKNSLAVSDTIINDETFVHVQDDEGTITGTEDGSSASNNRTDLISSDESVSSNSNENNGSPISTLQRNSLEEYVNMRSDTSEGNYMNESGGIQMQDMSPKPEGIESSNPSMTRPVPIKSPLHSFGSVGNSFARKFNLNQFLVGDDYQAPPPGPNGATPTSSGNNYSNSPTQ